MPKKLTHQEVLERFRATHGDRYIYDKFDYVGSGTKVLIGCKEEGHGYFEQTPADHYGRAGCPICSNLKTVKEINSVWKLRPELIKYFVNPIDAETHAPQSGKRIKLKCPDCGRGKK